MIHAVYNSACIDPCHSILSAALHTNSLCIHRGRSALEGCCRDTPSLFSSPLIVALERGACRLNPTSPLTRRMSRVAENGSSGLQNVARSLSRSRSGDPKGARPTQRHLVPTEQEFRGRSRITPAPPAMICTMFSRNQLIQSRRHPGPPPSLNRDGKRSCARPFKHQRRKLFSQRSPIWRMRISSF